MVILDGIRKILEAAESVNTEALETVTLMLEECGGLDKIEMAQNHENQQVYKKAQSIIEDFFSTEEEDTALAPQTDASASQFTFQADAETKPSQGFSF